MGRRRVIHLDTHVLVWWTSTPELLSRAAAEAIHSAKELGISAIVFWEVSLLVRKGRLSIAGSVSEWAQQVLAIPRVRTVPITAEIALAADALEIHADPADRFIVATAMLSGARLISKDGLVRSVRQLKTVW